MGKIIINRVNSGSLSIICYLFSKNSLPCNFEKYKAISANRN